MRNKLNGEMIILIFVFGLFVVVVILILGFTAAFAAFAI